MEGVTTQGLVPFTRPSPVIVRYVWACPGNSSGSSGESVCIYYKSSSDLIFLLVFTVMLEFRVELHCSDSLELIFLYPSIDLAMTHCLTHRAHIHKDTNT